MSKQNKVVIDHCIDLKRVLVVEDAQYLSEKIQSNLNSSFNIICDTVSTQEEALQLLEKNTYEILIMDIYLPDSSGNFLGYLIRKKYKLIVITVSSDGIQREKLTSLPIVDYLYKTNEHSIVSYINTTIKRFIFNQNNCVMVCDDSKLARRRLIHIIENQNIPYIETSNGQEAYDYILANKNKINLLIIDINMPVMDGLKLTSKIRRIYDKYELPILVLSGSEDRHIISDILKTGANDYISKPLKNEEFLTRFNSILDSQFTFNENKKLLERMEVLATIDELTQLYNRNFFYKSVAHIHVESLRSKNSYGVIMIDIDNFKKINDTYGHGTGDKTLKITAECIRNSLRDSDYVFRWGGEEFLVLSPKIYLDDLLILAERIRISIESKKIFVNETQEEISVTASLGISLSEEREIDKTIKIADRYLYKAKKAGKNIVIHS